MSQTGPMLSTQDLQDLHEIRQRLPQGDPRVSKIDTLVQAHESQPTQFEQQRSGGGGFLGGVKDYAKRTLTMPSTFDLATEGLPGIRVAKSAFDAVRNAPSAIRGALASQPTPVPRPIEAAADVAAPLLGMDVPAMREKAAHGDTGGVAGEASIPTALSMTPLAEDAASAARPRVARVMRTEGGSGPLRPTVRGLARAGGAGAGFAAGGWPGLIMGREAGAGLLDVMTPRNPQEFDIPAARDQMYNDLGGRLVRRGKEQDAIDRATARASKAPPLRHSLTMDVSLPTETKPIIPQVGNPTPNISWNVTGGPASAPAIGTTTNPALSMEGSVVHVPEPREIPGERPGAAWSQTKEGVIESAQRGQSGAIPVIVQRDGRPVLVHPSGEGISNVREKVQIPTSSEAPRPGVVQASGSSKPGNVPRSGPQDITPEEMGDEELAAKRKRLVIP